MQYLTIKKDDTLLTISRIVGRQNCDLVLNENGLLRTPYIGKQYYSKCADYLSANPDLIISADRKKALLNNLTDNEEIFEKACLMDDDGWKIFSAFQSFPDAIKVPESIVLPYSSRVIGSSFGSGVIRIGSNVTVNDSLGVDPPIYKSVMEALTTEGEIDPSIFNKVNVTKPVSLVSNGGTVRRETRVPQYAYSLPWGKIQIYSSLLDRTLDIPAYPEEMETERNANYTSMPEIIYQYEPWVVYQSSGPRDQSIEFHLHRDLWSGDHRDGKANELIRFCEANTFPKYTGSTVLTPIVKIYVAGSTFISGVLTKTRVSWSGPLGLDNWYLEFKLSLSIQEVSDIALNIDKVSRLGIIGAN